MPKKTSRAARTEQNQRAVRDTDKKKVGAVSPLVNFPSALIENDIEPTNKTEVVAEIPRKVVAATPTPLDTIRPALTAKSRGPLANRRYGGNRQAVISREEEYNFVRSDLRTVFILTVVMIIALVVLTVIIGR
ncbi:MAG: hypothetical protein HXX20_03380 [Chloroflexi bacterium]|nr:hypothetical protein [Chloroflexota bacterium]